jgi:hypothetical protein
MEFDQIIFGSKTFSSLLEDIYKNSKNKEKQIREMIIQLKDMITEPGDAIMMVPLLKEYLDASIKNDEALIKMAGIVQKAMSTNASSDNGDFLSDRDKELLFEEIKKIDTSPKMLEN